MNPTDSDRLRQIGAIRELKAKYVLALDGHRDEQLRALFMDDAELTIVDKVGVAGEDRSLDAIEGRPVGPDEWIRTMREYHRGTRRFHVLYSSIIDVTSPTTARGLWSFSVSAARGYYEDEYRKEGTTWKFSAVRYIVVVPHEMQRLAVEVAASRGDALTQLAADNLEEG